MKKTLVAMATIACAMSAHAYDNWTSSNGQPVRSGTGLCWRDANWTPATAHPDCDGALKKAAPVKVAEAPKAAPAPAPVAVAIKQTYAGDTFFAFDKAVVTPAGKVMLDDLAAKINSIQVEVVIAVGHTDSVGSAEYNLKLGERRARAVKAYLVTKGVNASRIYVESKGETQPIADNKTSAGRAKNRRVEIEVVGTVK